MASSTIPQNPTSQTVAALLPKLHDADPDFRFMCLNDLFQVLNNGKPDFLHADFNTAARTVDGILKTLDDQNGEVQNLAIKCLAPLVSKLPNTILSPLIEKLSFLNLEHSVDNSIPAMALRTVVITLPRPVTGVSPDKDVQDAYSSISRVLLPRLVGKILVNKSAVKPGVKLPPPPAGMLDLALTKELEPEAMDVLIEVVRCFGPMLQKSEVQALRSLLFGILESEKASSVVKKRAVIAVSILAIYLPDDDLSQLVTQLIISLRATHLSLVQRRLYITIIGSLARSIPSRFGPYLKTLAPFVLAALSQAELIEQLENSAEDGEPDSEIDNVRESALVALESLLASCGIDMRYFTEDAISSAIRFLKYDPNYNEDDDEEMGGTQPDEDDEDEFDEDDEFEADNGFDDDDDDDDTSWKVRRCAAKALYTLISTRATGDLLDDGTLYKSIAPVLIQRFSEREENVRLEIIATIASLVRKTGEGVITHIFVDELDYISQAAPQSRKRRRESSTTATFDTKTLLSMSAGLTSPTIQPVPTSGPKADLARLTPLIIISATKLLKGYSIPTKQAILNLLDDLISVQNGGLGEYFGQIIGPILDAIKTPSGPAASSAAITGAAASATANTLRIAALRLVGDIAKTHSSSVLQPYLPKIIPVVVSAVSDRFYKISSEAIGTVEELIKVLTPPRARSMKQDHQADLNQLYQVVVNRVSATEADLEVRHRAIHTLGILLARTSSPEGTALLSIADRATALDLLNDRLKNETTRISAVRAIDTVAALTTSKDQLPPKWIREVSLELSAQLRKADRSLRGASLGSLKNLITAPAARGSLDSPTIEGLVSALLPLITTTDLHLLGPALLVFSTLVLDNPKLVATDQLDLHVCQLLLYPLGGAVLEALLVLVTSIGEKNQGQRLMHGLLQDVSINGDPTVVGKVIGTLLVAGGQTVGVQVADFESELRNPASGDLKHSLALAVLGEVGLRLGAKVDLKPSTFLSQFNSKSDKVPLAAAIALGRAGAGNISAYVPEIMSMMAKGGSSQYLLLHSIKEILQQIGNTSADLSKYTPGIWSSLLVASRASDDNKAVGAECIGRVAIIEPKIYMPQLEVYLRDPNAAIRAMAIQAIRYTLPDGDENYDAVLKTKLVDMLDLMLHDPELENRRLALTTLNAAAHNKPDLIVPNLGELLPFVMNESIIKPELIREVMMGPFKHKVDDGLELRKSAYETLYALMETAPSRINIVEFYDRVVAGLKDEHDIRSLCNLMVTKLVVIDQDETARRLDAIADCFRTILSNKLKDNAVKQEIEKQEEAAKGVLRVSLLLQAAIPGATDSMGAQLNQHQSWRAYCEWLQKDFQEQLKAVKRENTNET